MLQGYRELNAQMSEVHISQEVFDRMMETAVTSATAMAESTTSMQSLRQEIRETNRNIAELTQQVGKLARLEQERQEVQKKLEAADRKRAKERTAMLKTVLSHPAVTPILTVVGAAVAASIATLFGSQLLQNNMKPAPLTPVTVIEAAE